MTEYDDAILDSSTISSTDKAGRPIPVTIPIALAQGITVTYTTRLGGLSAGEWGNCNLGGKGGDSAEAVLSNRIALAEAVGAPLSIISQVHSGKAVDVDEVFGRNAPFGYDFSGTQDDEGHTPEGVTVIEADAQVTSRKGVALGVFAADCLPVLLADPQAGVIGVAHCGRKGLQTGVIGSAVDLMTTKGAVPERIVATLGPRICGDCYETGDEIADEFDAQFPGSFSLTRFGGTGINIVAAALSELAEAGVVADNIIESRPRVNAAIQYLSEDAELAELCANDGEGPASLEERISAIHRSMCTVENPLWYSHRRAALAGKTHEGRMLALIQRS